MFMRLHLLFLVILLSFLSCSAESPPSVLLPDSREYSCLYVLKEETWGTDSVIDVCWEDSGVETNFVAERNIVMWAVKSTWERFGNLTTRGWGPCEARGRRDNIRIAISDRFEESPHTKGLGKKIDHRYHGMVLNMTFKHWGQGWPAAAGSREEAIHMIALHEFGHALGFAHEQNRDDADRRICHHSPQGSNGNRTVGYYDQRSVMNYCSEGRSLTSGDIVGLQRFYGHREDAMTWPRFNQRMQHVHTDSGDWRPRSPWFDPLYYKLKWLDLRQAGVKTPEALEQHYMLWGIGEGRQAAQGFDPRFYLQKNLDVANLFGKKNYSGAAMHFQLWGLDEGRAGSAEFDPKWYLQHYRDVAHVYGKNNYFEALVHFYNEGRREGRLGASPD